MSTPGGTSFPTAVSEQPLLPYTLEEQTLAASQNAGCGCSHDKNDHVDITLTAWETEVQNNALCHDE